MCSRQRWKDQFRLRNFLLEHRSPDDFVKFEWGWPKFFIAWRTFWAVYHLTWIIVSGVRSWEWATSKANEVKWFIYLTDWTYFMLTLSALVELVAVVYVNIGRPDIIKGESSKMTWYLKAVWVIFNVGNCSSIVISVLYWSLLYKPGVTVLTAVDIGTHLLNSAYVISNLIITSVPVRFYHLFHTMVYSMIYVIFTVIYQKSGGTSGTDKPYIYSPLDWDDPGTAAMYSCLTVFIAVPVIHTALFLLYMLRVAVFDTCLKRNSAADIEMNNSKFPA